MKASWEIGRGFTRGYLAGIGTSGSLLAGAALMFILASALVAFRGWPHVGAQPSPGEVIVSPRPTAARGTPVARRLALITAGPARGAGAAARPDRGVPAGVRGGRVRTGALGPESRRRRSIGTRVSASAPSRGSVGTGGSLPGLGSPPGRPVSQVQPDVGQATGTLGKVVSGTGSRVGSVVRQTTSTSAGVVRQTTSTSAGVVRQVSPPAAGVVQTDGSGAANAVGRVTQGVGGVLSGIGQP